MVGDWQERVVERLTWLEAQNGLLRRRVRSMGRVGVVSLAGLLGAVAAGASMLDNNPEIRPGQIVIRDPQGSQNRIVLTATSNGAAIDFRDGNNAQRVTLGFKPGAQSIYFTDQNGVKRELP